VTAWASAEGGTRLAADIEAETRERGSRARHTRRCAICGGVVERVPPGDVGAGWRLSHVGCEVVWHRRPPARYEAPATWLVAEPPAR
jgi:hypothetical protein